MPSWDAIQRFLDQPLPPWGGLAVVTIYVLSVAGIGFAGIAWQRWRGTRERRDVIEGHG